MVHTTGIAPFSRLAEQVMTSEPYASANRVFWIVDNGSSHRGAASINRMAMASPRSRPGTTPSPGRFGWNFTHNDLEDLLYRIDAHDNRQPHALAA